MPQSHEQPREPRWQKLPAQIQQALSEAMELMLKQLAQQSLSQHLQRLYRQTRTDGSLKYKAFDIKQVVHDIRYKTIVTRQFYPRLVKLPTHQYLLPFFLKAPTTRPQEQESSLKVPGIQPCTHQTFEDRYREPHQP